MLKRNLQTGPTVLTVRTGSRDNRAGITMWGLMVWAYKRELVRACTERVAPDFAPGGSNTSAVCRVLSTGIVGSGPVARITKVPVAADAEWVHGLVKTLDRDEYWLMVKSAEADAAPEWNPHIVPARVIPILKANGKPRMIVCPIEKRPVACRIRIEGTTEDEAQAIRVAAREKYAAWYKLLWALREKIYEEDALNRWRVTGIGAEAQPWVSAVASGC